MKNKQLFLLIVIFFFSSLSFAQNKKLTMEDAIWNVWFDLAPEDLDQIHWRANSQEYVYIKDWGELYSSSIKDKNDKIICKINDINNSLVSFTKNKIRGIYDIIWLDYDNFYQVYGNFVYVYNVKDKKVTEYLEFDENADYVTYFPKTNRVAYTIDNNLYFTDKKFKDKAITNETDKGIVCGSGYTHREEFGINEGIFWSPEGNYVAFYRKDETMVADYPLTDYTTFPASLVNIKYPMAGQTSENVTLGIYNFATGSTVYVKTGEPKEQYLTVISWDPNEKYVYIGILNRDQNHLKYNKYDATTGEFVKTLFEEKNPKYVEPQDPAIYLPVSKNNFLWYSQRDGYKHLYLYDTDGNLIQQITKGAWIVTQFYGFSKDEKNIYIQSTAECGVQRHIYKINIKSGKLELLTTEHGWHDAQFTADFTYFIDKHNSTEVPNTIVIKDEKQKIVKNLITSNNPLSNYKLATQKIGKIKAADGTTDLYYSLITPPNFDATKKYPAIIYVYGGPHAQMITDTWLGGISLWNFYMAQEGYVMFTVDNRGSADRGFDFESVIHRNLGVEEIKDQLEGVKFLKSLGYIDENRIGVHGWSFGGFMTTSLMTTYPNVFKVGVAGGPVIDWKYYEVMYGERYMDTPQSNPEGYKNACVTDKLKNLKGKLLLIHGGVDPVVVPQNSMDILLKSQELGIQVDFYVYPDSEHNVRGKGRIHLMQKITDYFIQNL